MAEQNGERATVALVSAKIDGLNELMQARFNAIQQQLDRRLGDLNHEISRFEPLPLQVANLQSADKDHEQRLLKIETEKARHNEWKRGPLMIAIFAGISGLINLLVATGVVH